MNRILYGLVAGVVSVCTATAAQQQRREDQPMAEEAVTSWDSPKLLRIKEDWRALWETYLKTPEKLPADRSNSYEKVKEMQGHLFRTSLSDKEARNLAASCGSLPVRCKDWSEPDNAVVAFMVEAFVYSRDRESLVRLFSTRFPLWIGNWPTEYYLAMAAEGRLKDAILVLGEAYSKSRVPEVRTRHWSRRSPRFRESWDPRKRRCGVRYERHEVVREREGPRHVDGGYWDSDNALPLEPEERAPGFYEEAWRNRPPLFTTSATPAWPEGRDVQSDEAGPKPAEKVVDWRPCADASAAESEKDLAKLEGTWSVVRFMGVLGPTPQARIRGVRYVFHKGLLTVILPDHTKVERGHIKICSQQREPLAFDLVKMSKWNTEEVTVGIYEFKGDVLRISLARRGEWQRPTSFQVEQGSGQNVITLKRAGKRG